MNLPRAVARPRQVSVFAPMGTVDHQTGILNAARAFAAAGWEVDFYTVRNRRYVLPEFGEPQVRLHVLPWTFDAEPEPRWVVTLLFAAWILAMPWRRHRLVFAGGIRGLLVAWLLALLRRVPLVNYQTELYVGSKLDTRLAALVKAVERRAGRRSLFSIDHDPARAALLAADHGVPLSQVVVVPNAPMGPARRHDTRWLHGRLGLPPSTPLLLCPGTLGEAFRSEAVVDAAQHLRGAWQCVLHSAQPRAADEPYVAGLAARDRAGRVRLSLSPVPYTRIDDLLASARVGIVLYADDLGENTAAVGLASGKLSHFLKLGIPVIVSPLPGLADFVLRHGVGAVLEHPAQLPELLARLEQDHDACRARCLACFDAHLAYEAAFAQVLRRLDAEPVA